MITISLACVLIATTTVNAPTIVHVQDSTIDIKVIVHRPSSVYRCESVSAFKYPNTAGSFQRRITRWKSRY